MFTLSKSKKRSGRPKFNRGFTLMELMVCLIIIMAITLIARSSKTTYERSLILTNTAYDVALAIREAQVYATNARNTGFVTVLDQCPEEYSDPSQCDYFEFSSYFNAGYGISFRQFSNSTQFSLFTDLNNNKYFDYFDQIVRTYTIKNNNRIGGLCATNSNSPCVGNGNSSYLDVEFRRPEADAYISRGGGTLYTQARIRLVAPNGSERCVNVYATGQVSVTPICN